MAHSTLRLSVEERDRRYALLREQLEKRGVDCAIVGRSNLFYVTNGIPGEWHPLLPTEQLPPNVALHDRNVVDLPSEARRAIQAWAEDSRPGREVRSTDGLRWIGPCDQA